MRGVQGQGIQATIATGTTIPATGRAAFRFLDASGTLKPCGFILISNNSNEDIGVRLNTTTLGDVDNMGEATFVVQAGTNLALPVCATSMVIYNPGGAALNYNPGTSMDVYIQGWVYA